MFDMLYFAVFTNFMCCIMCLRMRCFFASSLESVPLSDSPTWVHWVTRPKTLEHSQILIVFCTSCANTPVIWGTRNHGRRRSTSNDGAAAVRPSSTGCADGKRFWALKSAHYRLEYLWIKGDLSKKKGMENPKPQETTGFPLSDFAKLWRGFSPTVTPTSLEGGPFRRFAVSPRSWWTPLRWWIHHHLGMLLQNAPCSRKNRIWFWWAKYLHRGDTFTNVRFYYRYSIDELDDRGQVITWSIQTCRGLALEVLTSRADWLVLYLTGWFVSILSWERRGSGPVDMKHQSVVAWCFNLPAQQAHTINVCNLS